MVRPVLSVDHPWKIYTWITLARLVSLLVGPLLDQVSNFHSHAFSTGWYWKKIVSWKNTLLRVIPTMTFIHFVTGKSSGILSDISSGILSDILSGISSGILPGISSGISSGILPGISSGISSGILSGKSSGILSGISSGTIWPLRSSGAHWAGKVPGWGPAVHTELGRSPVEVQRCTLRWAAPRLRSSGAHWAGQLAGWGPAVRTELGSSQVDVQQCALSWEVGEELGDELARLARRKWRWKRRRRGGGRGGQLVEEEEEAEEEEVAGMRSDKI